MLKSRTFIWVQADIKTGNLMCDSDRVPYTYPTKKACQSDLFPGNYPVRVGFIAAPCSPKG